jgi:hypothetical protein
MRQHMARASFLDFFSTFIAGHPILVLRLTGFGPVFQTGVIQLHPEMVFMSAYSIYRRSLNG